MMQVDSFFHPHQFHHHPPTTDDSPLDELLNRNIDIACVRRTLELLDFVPQSAADDEHHFIRATTIDGLTEEVVVKSAEETASLLQGDRLVLTWTACPPDATTGHAVTLHDGFIDTAELWLHVAQLLHERPSGLRWHPPSDDTPPLHMSQLIAE
jgi:hypothetical protein